MTLRSDLAWMTVFALFLLSVATAAQTPPKPEPTASAHSYTNPVYRWSVPYPADWKIDITNPGDVRIHSPASDGLCGIRSGVVRFKTVDEFTDFMQAESERLFRDSGVTVRSLATQKISLPNEVIGNDVVTEILSGGRSRRIYVLANAGGYDIDCETYAQNWEKLEPFFARIIGSFTLDKP